MINYIIKTIALLTILLLPTVTLAQDCAANDGNCEITKKQTDSLKKTGIKPLETTPLSLTNDSSDKSKQAAAPTTVVQPFEIPTPGDTDTKSDSSLTSNNTSANTQTQNTAATTSVQQPINIYR